MTKRGLLIMNTKSKLIALAISTMAFNSVASAADKPWYVGISINQADLDTIETVSTEQVAGVSRTIGIDSDDETGFGVTIGRTLFTQGNGNKLSVELNYANSDHDLEELRFMGNSFVTSEGASEGSVEIETILARVKYEFNVGKFKPYVGFGIGQSDLEVDIRYGGSVGSAPTTQPPFATGGDSATAIELRAGLEYEVSDSVGLFIEYSTTDVDDIEFSRTGGGPGGLATTTQSGDYDVDSLNLGINFYF